MRLAQMPRTSGCTEEPNGLVYYTFRLDSGQEVAIEGPPGEDPEDVWEAMLERARLARDCKGCFGRWLARFRDFSFAWHGWEMARRDAAVLTELVGSNF